MLPMPHAKLAQCRCRSACKNRLSAQLVGYHLVCFGRVELISWQPRAFLYHSFLSPAECRHIMQEAKPMVTAFSHNYIGIKHPSLHLPCCRKGGLWQGNLGMIGLTADAQVNSHWVSRQQRSGQHPN